MHLRWGPTSLAFALPVVLGSLLIAADLSPDDIAAARRSFWAYQPITDPPPPDVAGSDWPANDIDRFILSKLHDAGLEPAADADRATLIRRLCFDLTGLPPTAAEIDAFVNDKAPDAYERLVERLLASPRFGERWGRHWLDVARFAESSGGGRSMMFPDAWRYRDYVIRSVNADKPMDAFIVEQLAGDLIVDPLPDNATEADRQRRADQLVATGFLALGAHNYEQQDKEQLRMDVIDEQIATVGRAFLGMTLDCARCHDHKFDPIPASDYYALAGIFRSTNTLRHANVSTWIEHDLPLDPALAQRHREHKAQLAAIDGQVKTVQDRLKALKGTVALAAVAPEDLPGIVVDDVDADLTGEWVHSTHVKRYVGAGYIHDGNEGKGDKSATFTAQLPEAGVYEVRLAYTPGDGRAHNVAVTVEGVEDVDPVTVDQRPTPPIDAIFVSLGRYRFEQGPASVTVRNAETDSYVIVDAVQFLPEKVADELALAEKKQAEIDELNERLKQLEDERKRSQKDAPPPAPNAMGVADESKPGDWHFHIRGLAHQRGDLVPRGFLAVASPADAPAPNIPDDASGRLELARWIASPDNPLTARVLVNRIWQKLIGEGIVRTVDNFGTTGQTPDHPELLDHLASRYIADGWSLKATVRRIVLSRTYRMSSTPSAHALAKDPENRLLAHAHRRRLDAESMRDAMLAVSGQLDPAMGGRTITKLTQYDLGYKHGADFNRRSVYIPAFRNAVPDQFEVFDAATPNVPMGHRPTSILPTQSLYMMNAPEMMDRSRAAAERLLGEAGLDRAGRIELAYRRTLGRAPTDIERTLATDMLAGADTDDQRRDRWALLMQALFASVDFRYLD